MTEPTDTPSKLDARQKRRVETKRKRYAEDPEYREKMAAGSRAFYAAHKIEINASRRQKRKEDPQKKRKSYGLRKYGITLADYDAMLARQNGLCAICQKKPDRTLAVDHCHVTGRVRRLLCLRCNVGLGNFDDDPIRVLEAAAYLLPFQDEQQHARLRAWAASSAASALRALFLPAPGPVRGEIIMLAETGTFRLRSGKVRRNQRARKDQGLTPDCACQNQHQGGANQHQPGANIVVKA